MAAGVPAGAVAVAGETTEATAPDRHTIWTRHSPACSQGRAMINAFAPAHRSAACHERQQRLQLMLDTYVGAADSKQGAFLSQAQSKA